MRKLIYAVPLFILVYGLYLAWVNRSRLSTDASLEKFNAESMKDYGDSLPHQNTDAIIIHRWGRAMTQQQYNKIKWKLSLFQDWYYTFGPSMTDKEFKDYLGK